MAKKTSKKSAPFAFSEMAHKFRRATESDLLVRDQLGRLVNIEVKTKPRATPLDEGDEYRRAVKEIQSTVLESKKAKDQNIARAYSMSDRALPGYSTLDYDHIREIRRISQTISDYVDDKSRRRPLNILMLAAPGAGKSHIIKQIAKRMDRKAVTAITFNMAAMLSNEDLLHPLDAARNLKVADRVPLLFLDEFDSKPQNYSLLLPLLWDGELHLGHRDLKLGKVIVVLAGSDPSLPETMEEARSMQLDINLHAAEADGAMKLTDLLSRINGGVLQLPGLDAHDGTSDRRVDKVCIAISLLRDRFGDQLSEVPRSLLRFIGLSRFRYGVRSIAHLVELIVMPKKKPARLDSKKLGLPFQSVDQLKKSSLAYHLASEDQAHGVFDLWKECAKDASYIAFGNSINEFLRQFVTAHESAHIVPRRLSGSRGPA